MGIVTAIEYADSTLNIETGCEGCELWQDKTCLICGLAIEQIGDSDKYQHKPSATVSAINDHEATPTFTCYAGNLVTRYASLKGWPESFDKPKLFLRRLIDAQRWPDLSGTKRKIPLKPWLDNLPRFIFLNDLGDTFTEGLPKDWLGVLSPELANLSPLQVLSQMKATIMILTKRATQMRQFFERYECPNNFIVMVSVTGPETINRVHELVKIKARWRGISAEPLLRDTVDAIEPYLSQLHWCATGYESGAHKRPADLRFARHLRDACKRYGTRLFMKQVDKVQAIPPDLRIFQLPEFRLETT